MSYPRPRHDIYDDTRYARHDARRDTSRKTQQRAPPRPKHGHSLARTAPPPAAAAAAAAAAGDRGYRAPAHYPQPDEQPLSSRDARRAHDSFAHEMREELARAEHEFGPLFAAGAGLFGGLLSSFDRVFDDMSRGLFDESGRHGAESGGRRQRGGDGGGGGGSGSSSFFYESRRTTVGPDGRVREETVRTTPGPDGKPHTTRNVREGTQRHGAPYWHPSQSHRYGVDGAPAPPQRPGEPDVVVEELDEHGNVISSNAPPGYPRQRLEQPHGGTAPRATPPPPPTQPAPGSWLHNRYQQWRGNRA